MQTIRLNRVDTCIVVGTYTFDEYLGFFVHQGQSTCNLTLKWQALSESYIGINNCIYTIYNVLPSVCNFFYIPSVAFIPILLYLHLLSPHGPYIFKRYELTFYCRYGLYG
uniref:Uncharacterized protein n=1 Tax=Cacopsylla melanoneura TaxID=428564 RepID=A0A8D8S958_9HEMI